MDTNIRNSGNYQENLTNGNAFTKHEERKKKLKELSEKVQYKALLRLAKALGITPEDLLRILAGFQGITPKLGRRIDYQWAIEFGKVKIEVPKPFLEPEIISVEPIKETMKVSAIREPFLKPEIIVPEPPKVDIKKCTTITRLSGLEDKNTIYDAINSSDGHTDLVDYKNYDHAIDTIATWLEEWTVKFFRKKDKAMRLVKATELSISTHYDTDCPKSRRFEFELIDIETEELKYGFIYTKGQITWSLGNLPLSEIVYVLKRIGVWEI